MTTSFPEDRLYIVLESRKRRFLNHLIGGCFSVGGGFGTMGRTAYCLLGLGIKCYKGIM